MSTRNERNGHAGPRVLIVAAVLRGAPLRAQGNYNSWFLFHGLRTLLGSNAVDSHAISFLYEQPLDVVRKQRGSLYGLGFGYAYKLPQRSDVERAELEQQLARGRFDLVIFADPLSVMRRGGKPWLYDTAVKVLPKSRIMFLHAPDLPYPNPRVAGYDVTQLYEMGTVLQREIPDCRYFVPPDRTSEAMKRCVWYRNANCFDDVNIAATIERVPALKRQGHYTYEWPVVSNATGRG